MSACWKIERKAKVMKVLLAGMAAIGAAFCSMNVGAAIYVNGVNTSEKTSGGGRVGSAGHIRKE